MLFHCVVAVSGDISYRPKSQAAFAGGKAILICASNTTRTAPSWKVKRKLTGESEWIVTKGKVNNKHAGGKYSLPAYKPRPEPQFQSDDPAHQLVVHNLTSYDEGMYTCYEDQKKNGKSASANVTVVEIPKPPGKKNLPTLLSNQSLFMKLFKTNTIEIIVRECQKFF